MRTKFVAAVGSLVLGTTLFGWAVGAEEAASAGTNQAAALVGQPQTRCPVMRGNAIEKKYFADYEGKRVYFCCGVCPRKFAKNPDRYMKEMREAGVALEDAPGAEAEPAEGAPGDPMEEETEHTGHHH